MGSLRGVPVTLYTETQIGVDRFNQPLYEETPVTVDNVLISPTSQTETLEAVNLYGKKAVYTLAIPKGDTHEWEDRRVDFFGKSWRVFGIPSQGIDDLIPLGWNLKVTVERYE
jgi:hypothetical protein